MEKGTFTYIALALLLWAMLGTIIAGYYFAQSTIYQNEYESLANEFNTLSNAVTGLSEQFSTTIKDLSTSFSGEFHTLSDSIENLSEIMESISLRVDIYVSYGNGTDQWYNDTALPLSSTGFTAILAIAEIQYTDYGGDLGILVTSINGVTSNSTHGWFHWYRDIEQSEWILPEYSSAKYILHRGDVIAWTYTDFSVWPPPTPT